MKIFWLFLGCILLVAGLVWIGQGLDYIQWPARSFMINEIRWTYYGVGLVILGCLVIWAARRR
jgi:hypothetical protein